MLPEHFIEETEVSMDGVERTYYALPYSILSGKRCAFYNLIDEKKSRYLVYGDEKWFKANSRIGLSIDRNVAYHVGSAEPSDFNITKINYWFNPDSDTIAAYSPILGKWVGSPPDGAVRCFLGSTGLVEKLRITPKQLEFYLPARYQELEDKRRIRQNPNATTFDALIDHIAKEDRIKSGRFVIRDILKRRK